MSVKIEQVIEQVIEPLIDPRGSRVVTKHRYHISVLSPIRLLG